MNEPITIPCQNIKLEGMLHKKSIQRAALICHPHPLYGGNMDNPVVTAISDGFLEKGFTSLRFNFRGTCNSTGMFDHGDGEQEDVRAALSWLADQGYEKIWLCGYSFGARINASVVSKGCDIQDHIMVSPPAGMMSFDDVETMPATGLIVTGARDEIAPAGTVRGLIRKWQIRPRFEIIDNCDHFYSGCLGTLKTILTDYLP